MSLLAKLQGELEELQRGIVRIQCEMQGLNATTVFGLASAALRAGPGEAESVQQVAVLAARQLAESKGRPVYLFNPICVLLQMTCRTWPGAESIIKELSSVSVTREQFMGVLRYLSTLGLGLATVHPDRPMSGYFDELPGLRAALYGGALPVAPLPEVLIPPLLLACCAPYPRHAAPAPSPPSVLSAPSFLPPQLPLVSAPPVNPIAGAVPDPPLPMREPVQAGSSAQTPPVRRRPRSVAVGPLFTIRLSFLCRRMSDPFH